MCAFNGVLSVWDQISVTIFCQKEYFLAREKTECFTKSFLDRHDFLLFSSAYFLDIMSPMFPQVLALILGCHGRIQRGAGGPDPLPPEKSQQIKVSKQYWSRSSEKSQSYKASIQCWAIIGPPAKHHLNGQLQRVHVARKLKFCV